MTAPFSLEVFDKSEPSSSTVFLTEDRLAQIKRDALQTGHDLGYRKAREELDFVSADTAARLTDKIQNITFTHFEARKAVLSSLEGLICQMTEAILPGIAKIAFPSFVTTEVLSVAATMTDSPVRICCSEENVDVLRQALQLLPEMPVGAIAVAESDCGALEVRIISPENEMHIDIDQTLIRISEEVAAFYKLSTEDRKHG